MATSWPTILMSPGFAGTLPGTKTGNENREKSGNSVFVHMTKNFHKFTGIITHPFTRNTWTANPNLKTLSSTKQMAENFTEIVRDLFCGAVRPKSAKTPPNGELFEKTREMFRAWPGNCGCLWTMILRFRRWRTAGKSGHLLLAVRVLRFLAETRLGPKSEIQARRAKHFIQTVGPRNRSEV